jgi:hypothetical protein
MTLITCDEILSRIAQGERIVCIDIRELSNQQYLRVTGGVKIPYADIHSKINRGELDKFRSALLVVCAVKHPPQCGRAKAAYQNLEKGGFQVAALDQGLVTGWLIKNRTTPLPQ